MCVILDTNKLGDFKNRSEDMKPLHKWLQDGGQLIYSNHQKVWKEIEKSGVSDDFRDLRRNNRAKLILKNRVEKAVRDIKREYELRSDDPHILGLAKAANVKLLCTEDEKLIKDFKKTVRGGRVYRMKGRNRKKIREQAKKLLNPNTCPRTD